MMYDLIYKKSLNICHYFMFARAEGGDLQTVLDSEEFLEEFICREVLRDALRGLQFLHSHSIAHLDIKVNTAMNDCNNCLWGD